MAEATSIVCNQLVSASQYSIYELTCVATTAETATIPTTRTEVTTGTTIVPLIAWNTTSGTTITTLAYSAANRRFTITNSGMTDNNVSIVFVAKG